VNIDLPSEYEAILLQAVASGAFSNPQEALRHAIELLDAERTQAYSVNDNEKRLERWNERNNTAIEQSKQGLSKPLDDDAVMSRLNSRISENEGCH
jgi:Arc/MetJ-type ribon-helix-helix transcriptional regulator